MASVRLLPSVIHPLKFVSQRLTLGLPCIQRLVVCNMSTGRRPKVLVTRRVPESGISIIKNHCDLDHWDDDEEIPREELLKRIQGKDGIFCTLTDKIDKEVLDAAGSNLKVVSTMSVGHDHIDVQTCKDRCIAIGYTPEVLSDATATLTVGLLLATSRRLIEASAAVKDGTWTSPWKPTWLCGPGLSNSTVGIVGLGRIGLSVAKRLQPFGVKQILYTSRTPKDHASDVAAIYCSLDELLEKSDFVIVCCAYTPEAKEMFNQAAFKKMKKSAIFINTSRGALVNQSDLHKALTSGEIYAAGLDVTTPEPLPTDSPLLSLPNCVILPHIGSSEYETRTVMCELTARNLVNGILNTPMPAQLHV